MVNYCAVADCNSCSRNRNDIRFIRFPRDKDICDSWVKACGKNHVNIHYERMCSLHFTEDDWSLKDKLLNTPFLKRKLDPKAIPTQYLPGDYLDTPISVARKPKAVKRSTKKIVENFEQRFLEEHNISEYLEEEDMHEDNVSVDVLNRSPEAQENLDTKYSKELRIKLLEDELRKCKKENEQLKLECNALRSLETAVKSIFSEGQIQKLINPKSKLNWTLQEISSAAHLHSLSSRAYQFLYDKKFPLPGPSTLKLWAPRLKENRKVLQRKT